MPSGLRASRARCRPRGGHVRTRAAPRMRDAEVVQVVARRDPHVRRAEGCANGCGAGSRRHRSGSKPTASSTPSRRGAARRPRTARRRRRRCALSGRRRPGRRRVPRARRAARRTAAAARRSSAPARSRRAAGRRGARACRSRPRSGAAARRAAPACPGSARSRVGARLLPGLFAERVGVADLRGQRGGHRTAFSWSCRTAASSRTASSLDPRRPPRARARRAAPDLRVGHAGVADQLERGGVVCTAAAPPGGIIVFWSQNSRSGCGRDR